MRPGQLHSRIETKEFRKKLRSNMTPAEAILWNALKKSQLQGRKFRRQHGIGSFIVDFYCPAEKLVIELDGQVHFNPISSLNDEERDKTLERLGFRVIRFENKLVIKNLEGDLQEIQNCFNQKG